MATTSQLGVTSSSSSSISFKNNKIFATATATNYLNESPDDSITSSSSSSSSESSSNDSFKSEDEDDFISKFNEFSIKADQSDQWVLTKTYRTDKHNQPCYRLSSMGYHYVKDRGDYNDQSSVIQWKCDNRNLNTTERCRGRAHSVGLKPPVKVVTQHIHLPNKAMTQVFYISNI